MLLNRSRSPVIHMQVPNEEAIPKIIALVKGHLANSTSKATDVKDTVKKEPAVFSEVSFQVSFGSTLATFCKMLQDKIGAIQKT